MGASYLATLAEDLLVAATNALDPTRTGHAAPTRRFVSWGPPPVDACDGGQLTVHLASVDVNLQRGSGRSPGACLVEPVGRFQVQVWRCVPTFGPQGEIPDADDVTASSVALAVDAWCLVTGLTNAIAAGTLSEGRVEIGPFTPLPPGGGSAGGRIDLTYHLNDGGPT